MHVRTDMLLILAIILAIGWLFGYVVFHVASGAIHLLLILAVIGLVLYFVGALRGRGGTPVTR